jgi:2-keto-3-deoxy-L-rhamnonate aldolase RhmA
MRENRALSLVREGKPAIGLWLHTHSYHVARIVAAQGSCDWLLVDLEHTPVDLSTASMIFSTIADVSAGHCTPLARVAHGTMFQIKQALDAGAQGIIVPMINTAKDAADVVRFARYPPLGERGAGGLTPHLGFGTTSHVEYVSQANREILVAIQIESQEAIDNIDAILDVSGIDLVFIGPFDLHISLGLTPSLWSDQLKFRTAIAHVLTACQKRGLPYGTLSPNADGVKARLVDGFTFLSMGTDILHLLGSLNTQYEQLRPLLSEH